MKNNKKKEIKSISIPFKLTWPKKGENVKPVINTTTVSNTGILFTCILLSIASGFIDLTFFSGLSKSLFHVSTISVPAALLYTVISLGLISGKFWCAMRIGAIKELQTRLKNDGYKWWRNINKVKIRWHAAHKFLIGISIITALSLSVNSIGSGVRTIEQTIKNMTDDANELIELKQSVKEGEIDRRDARTEGISNKQISKETAKAEADTYWGYVEDYRSKRNKIEDDENLTQEEKKSQIATLRSIAVNRVPKLTSKNIEYISKSEFEALMKEITSSNEELDTAAVYEESIAYDKQQIEDKIKSLKFKDYRDPDGTPLQFLDENGEPYDIQVVISILQGSINKWQAPDAGDVGESSKIFTLIATYIKADTKAGGMGVSEWMLLILIAIVGIVQEFLIALFTPKSTIDRKLLYNYDAYFGEDFNIDLFLLKTYKDYLKKGVINQKEYEAKAQKCVELMEDTIEDDIARYSKKQKSFKDEVSEMTELLKQYQDQIEELKKEKAAQKVENFSNPIKDLAIEVPLDKPNFPDYSKQKAIFVGDSKKETEENLNEDFSEEVDKAVAEIDDLLKEE
jgi:hypothetical protein